MPGSIHNPAARGCHRLIREGALLVERIDEVLSELGPLAAVQAAPAQGAEADVGGALPEDRGARALLACIGHEPTSIEALVRRSGLTAQALSAMLLALELQGFVASSPGALYARIARKSKP